MQPERADMLFLFNFTPEKEKPPFIKKHRNEKF